MVTIRVPPLRERKEEIGPLARHFVEKYRRRYHGGLEEVPPEVMERFHAYDWPGNVRELENLVRRLVVLRDPAMVLGDLAPSLGAQSLPPVIGPVNTATNQARPALAGALPDDAPLKDVARRAARLAEREAILRALDADRLEQAQGRQAAAGELQGAALQDQGLRDRRPARRRQHRGGVRRGR